MAPHTAIQDQLERVARRYGRVRLWMKLAACWGVCAVAAWLILHLEKSSGIASSLALPVVAVAGIIAAIIVIIKDRRAAPDWRQIARNIEAQFPGLDGRLVTALQLRPEAAGQLSYLQQRLVDETLDYSRRADWAQVISPRTLGGAQLIHLIALGLFVLSLAQLRISGGHQLLSRTSTHGVSVTPGDVTLERGSSLVVLARFKGALPPNVTLAFGQLANLQRLPLVKSLGDPMFGGSIPEVLSNFVYHVEYDGQATPDFKVTVFEHPRLERSDASLTFPAYTGLAPKRIDNTQRISAVEGSQLNMALQFNKPVASARLVARDKSRSEITLALDTNAPNASLKEFSLESSRSYDLQLVDFEGRTNKVPAEFVFNVLKNRIPEMRLTSPRGDLRPTAIEEVSFEGTVWDDFGVKAYGIAYAVSGQPPHFIELGQSVAANEKKSFSHVLRLEEAGVKPDELVSWFVWADDLGPDGQPRRSMGDLYFGEVRPFEEVFREGQGMEGQGAGMGGGEDRTGKLTDLQKQIVNATWKLQRESSAADKTQSGAGSKNPVPRAARNSGDQSRSSSIAPETFARMASLSRFTRLAGQLAPSNPTGDSDPVEQRRPASAGKQPGSKTPGQASASNLADDVNVVLESQAQALEQAKEALAQQRNPQSANLWQKAVDDMEAALARLEKATNSAASLKEALEAEQQAYQALIRLQAHEYQVTRSRSRNQSGSGRNQQMQRQLEEMDLTESENRYENQREAQQAQNPQSREQLQILSRLQELARRQQDLNERLKELQAALAEARTAKERAEIERQLKRLQEEEKQMLNDVDELRQRMDRPENQSRLAEERRQLEDTRQDLQRASEAAGKGAPSQALAAGTRAQQQLQQLRDDLRKKSSSQFSEDMRQLRGQARELARRQQDILKKIQDQASSDRKSLAGDQDQSETRAALAKQKELLTNILDHATQVSQQAEEAEPLLSKQLYDTVRKFSQDTAKDLKEAESELLNHGPMTRSLFELLRNNSEQSASKLEEITSEMLRLGYQQQAGRIGERAQPGIENLKKGIEHAAQSVIGDDTEALRMAERQLKDVSTQLQKEINRGLQAAGQTNSAAAGADGVRPGQNPQLGQANTNTSESMQSARASSEPGAQAGQNQQSAQAESGEQQGSGQGRQQGESNRQQASAQAQQSAQAESGEQQGSGQGRQRGEPNGQQASAQGQQGDSSSEQGASAQAQSGQGDQPGAGQQGGEGQPNQTADASSPQNSGEQASAAGQNNGAGKPTRNRGAQQAGAANAGGGDPVETGTVGGARGLNWDRLLTQNAQAQNDPITGTDFTGWSDRLREVEELVDDSGMRDDVARARDRARVFRQDFKRERKKPDWAVLQLQVMKPLTEVHQKLVDELARRESQEALVPLDRDPVPNQYSDLVRRYYEELGKEK